MKNNSRVIRNISEIILSLNVFGFISNNPHILSDGKNFFSVFLKIQYQNILESLQR
jgi:hypothetical protein